MYADAATSVCSCSLSTVDRRRLHCLIISFSASYHHHQPSCIVHRVCSIFEALFSLAARILTASLVQYRIFLCLSFASTHPTYTQPLFLCNKKSSSKVQLQSSRVAVGDSRSSQDSLFSCVLLSSICSLTHSNKAAAAAAATVKTD